MSLAAAPLPENLDEPRFFAASLQSEPYAKTLHIEKPKARLAAPRRARFGRSSEKADREIEQIELALGDLEEPCGKGGTIETRHATEIDRRICSLEDGWMDRKGRHTSAPAPHKSPEPDADRGPERASILEGKTVRWWMPRQEESRRAEANKIFGRGRERRLILEGANRAW